MATKKLYDLAVKTGSYVVNGETKNRYQNIGAVMEGENGMYLMLAKWFSPAGVPAKEGSDSILVSCFEPRQQDGGGQRPATRPSQQQEMDDETPF